MANNLANFHENALIKAEFRGVAYTFPATVYLALYTTAAGEDLTGAVEVTGGSYARKVLTTSPTGSSSFTDPGAVPANSVSNSAIITFATASADWGIVVGWGLLDASSAGNLRWSGTFTTSRTILNGDTASIAANELVFSYD